MSSELAQNFMFLGLTMVGMFAGTILLCAWGLHILGPDKPVGGEEVE